MNLTFDVEDFKYMLEELERIQDDANGIGFLVSCEIEVSIGAQPFIAKYSGEDNQWSLTMK